jgi:hypothetical protein
MSCSLAFIDEYTGERPKRCNYNYKCHATKPSYVAEWLASLPPNTILYKAWVRIPLPNFVT